MTSTKSGWDAAFEGDPISRYDPNSPEVLERQARRRSRGKNQAKRFDIQGLRMVAVVAVVINHLTGHPQGGFVGVDVFFVISGYLITGHLLREETTSGRISLLDFYRRRIRRLFPAALTVIAATVLASVVVFGSASPRYHSTWVDAVWATLFSANWRFINVGTDYFAALGAESPLQHYWSLSVEEQFYLIWPITLIVVLFIARRAFPGRQAAAAATGAIAGILLCGASLVVAAQESTSEPTRAYFSTFTRGWELGLGALLAVAAPYMRGNRIVLTILSWLGLATILASLFLVNQTHFPFPGALAPCLGSGLVIIAHSRTASAANIILTNRLSNYFGDISYSIYVVHLPVIILAQAALNKTSLGAAINLALLPAILGLSMLLFHLIEDPIRNSRWLEPKRQKGYNVAAGIGRARTSLVGVSFAIVGVALLSLTIQPSSSKYADLVNNLGDLPNSPTPSGDAKALPTPELDKLYSQIVAALEASSYPKLNPPMSRVNIDPAYLTTCGDTKLGSLAQCSWGDPNAKHTIFLVGDSTSVAYTPAFKKIAETTPGWRVRALGGFGCGFGDIVLAEGAENQHVSGCKARNDAVLEAIRKTHPDLLVVTNVIGTSTYTNAVSGQLAKVSRDYGKVVMLPAPPKVIGPDACYSTTSVPADCVASVPSEFAGYLSNEQAVANRYGGQLIDPTPWYCVQTHCPIFVGTTPTRRDAQHTSAAYSQLLAPVIKEALENRKLLG